MKFFTVALTALLGAGLSSAFVPRHYGPAFRVTSQPSTTTTIRMAHATAEKVEIFDQEQFIQESKDMRMKHLEEQAMYALKIAVENYGNAVFPNAMIAGDIVITDLLARMGYLENGKAKIMVVDTFHLFPETMEFLKTLEDKYNFKAEILYAIVEGMICVRYALRFVEKA
jgi:phosphoadenosine phosphosulfate reductase